METLSPSSASKMSWSGTMLYLGAIVVSVACYLAIRQIGLGLTVPANPPASQIATSSTAAPTVNIVLHVLSTMVAVLVVGRLLTYLFKFVGQPAVIGELIAGILLGPSFLGYLWPEALDALIPSAQADPKSSVTSALRVVAQLGVIFYMFLVGLDLNLSDLKGKAHSAIAISHASILFPFILGSLLSLWLFPVLAPTAVSFTSFSLFMGVAMAITAFPVLARILTDQNLHKTKLGTMALSCAAADDVTAWCLLAFVIGIVNSSVWTSLLALLGSAIFVVCMLWIIRPWIQWLAQRVEKAESPTISTNVLSVIYTLLLLSAFSTELIGIHALFGAFLLGAVIPANSKLAEHIRTRLQEPVLLLLLPAFFAYTGMRTRIGLISDISMIGITVAIIVVATIGKFGGTFAAARFCGETWRSSTALGILMNTRGLMELIVLNIGLDLGIISPTLFTMMVVMAIATTVATSPLLRLTIPAAPELQRS